jgi:hypothetical protein
MSYIYVVELLTRKCALVSIVVTTWLGAHHLRCEDQPEVLPVSIDRGHECVSRGEVDKIKDRILVNWC